MLVKYRIGGKVGNGEQYISWIHPEDFSSIIEWIIENNAIADTLNCTAPNPVTNKELFKALRYVEGITLGLSLPAPLIKALSIITHIEPELLLGGCKALPKKLLSQGFNFQFANIESALTSLLPKQPTWSK